MLHSSSLKYDALIYDCRCLMNKQSKVDLGHVFREQTIVADELAKEGARRLSYGVTAFFCRTSSVCN